MTIQAPAKVNLVLRVLGKRPDGFHEIETLMAPISLADELDVEVSKGTGIELICDDPEIPVDAGNLVWRAVEVFARRAGCQFHTRIHLRKKTPHGAGLGGGSSDAAAALNALNELLATGFNRQELEALAASLGSDIPFFISSKPAWCRGRGELMQEAGEIPPTRLLLLKPPFPVPTGWAYQAWAAHRKIRSTPTFLGSLELSNDLEGPVFQKYLLLPVIKDWLLAQKEVSAAMMSGSGSTIFAVLNQNAGTLAQRAKEHFGPGLWTCEATI